MNCKAKGSRKERMAKKLLQEKGYQVVVKAGGSLGLFDLIAIGVDYDHVVAIQVKSNRFPSRVEMDRLRAFQGPSFLRKQVWVYVDRRPAPTVLEV